MVKTQESRAISAWATDRLDALPMSGAIKPHHGRHRQRLGSKSRRQALSERRDACPQRWAPEILVKNAEGGVTFVVGV